MFGNRLSDLNTLKRKFRVAECLNSSFHLTAFTLLVIRTIPLILFVEMIVVYSERYVEYINTLSQGAYNFEYSWSGTYTYHRDLKV